MEAVNGASELCMLNRSRQHRATKIPRCRKSWNRRCRRPRRPATLQPSALALSSQGTTWRTFCGAQLSVSRPSRERRLNSCSGSGSTCDKTPSYGGTESTTALHTRPGERICVRSHFSICPRGYPESAIAVTHGNLRVTNGRGK